MSWHHVLDTKERNTADHIMERWTTLKQWLQVDGVGQGLVIAWIRNVQSTFVLHTAGNN